MCYYILCTLLTLQNDKLPHCIAIFSWNLWMNPISKDMQTSSFFNSRTFEFSLPLNSKINVKFNINFVQWNTVLNFVHQCELNAHLPIHTNREYLVLKTLFWFDYRSHKHEGQCIVVSSREHIFAGAQISGWQNISSCGSQPPGWPNWQVYCICSNVSFLACRYSYSPLEHHQSN